MPLCPQITITPITVTSSNMTVTSVIAGGEPATTERVTSVNTTATTALANASTALSDAATALTTANTAQATANGKNKVTYSASAPGSTANTAGDIWFRYSGTTIIAQYEGQGGTSWRQVEIGNAVIANLDAGKITSGILSAGLVTITNTGSTSGQRVQLDSSGLRLFDSGGNATAYLNSSTGVATFSGGTFRTASASSTPRVDVGNTGSNYISFVGSGGQTNLVGGALGTSFEINTTSGPTVTMDGTGTTFGGGTTARASVSILGTGTVSGDLTANAQFYIPNRATSSSAANVRMNTITGQILETTSSRRYKKDIEPAAIPAASVLQLAAKTFTPIVAEPGVDRVLGLIAEEVAEIPVLSDLLVNYDEQGRPDSISYDRLAVALLDVIKDLSARVAALEAR